MLTLGLTFLTILSIVVCHDEENTLEEDSNIFYDEELEQSFYKVVTKNGQNEYFIITKHNKSISCPLNSNMFIFEEQQVGICVCGNAYAPSTDRKKCILAKNRLESCNELNPCSPYAGLICQNGKCECDKDAAWDESDSLCYSDTACRNRKANTFYEPTSTPKCVKSIMGHCEPDQIETYPCPKHSTCVQSDLGLSGDPFMCLCDKGFKQSSDHKSCNPVKLWGESCTDTSVPCMEPLSCINNTTCDCENNLVWDPADRRCDIAANSPCTLYGEKQCVRNSKCDSQGYEGKRTCICADGYEANGRCFGRHMSSCKIGADCLTEFSCIDGICKCPTPINQAYIPYRYQQKCLNLVDSPCTNNASATKCVEKAKCNQGTCQCSTGYSKSWNRQCMKTYQQICKGKNDCNFNEGLACIEGICTCIDPGLKFIKGSGCVGTSGSPCGKLEEVGKCKTDGSEECKKYFVSCQSPTKCSAQGQCEV